MSQTQRCYVCGTPGSLVDGRLQSTEDTPAGPVLIAQCPCCKRFICSRHSEKLALSADAKRSLFSFGARKPTTLTACCPFDPGVALGDRD